MADHEAIDRRRGDAMTDLGFDRRPDLADMEHAADLRPLDESSEDAVFRLCAEMATAAAATPRTIHQTRGAMPQELRMQAPHRGH